MKRVVIVVVFPLALAACGSTTTPPTVNGVTVTSTITKSAPAITTTTTATTTATATVTTKATPATITRTIKVTPAPVASFQDGVYNVGPDIKPGTYRTTAAVTADDNCYWEIDSAPGSDNILQNDNVVGGRPTVVLRRGQQFKSENCGAWGRQ